MIPDNYLYAIVDFLTIIFPFVLSFLPINPVYKKWRAIVPAILIPGILFLFWDNLFASWGVWGFNQKYIIGIYFFHLPLEEVLWFICIPYACIFSYEAVNYYFREDILNKKSVFFSVLIIFFLAVVGSLNYGRLYTSVTFFALSIFLFFVQWIWKPIFLGRFYLAFSFILIPFFIVNGVLTGTGIEEPIIWYNNLENLDIRLGTIPVEDTFYGMLLILLNISLFEVFQKKSIKTNS
ncbi:MAG: lycopene cyclase domain-containing protein [Flammeovirgaceae bacterium]|jgi:lycopene cyclase domain-containing protein|nr:lycopene cyclase domain-containing protein [Flammeovirgaceae bacterium]